MNKASEIARLKITLDHVKPPVVRRVEVPADIRLDDLHLVIQIVMGWENYHLYEFRTRGGRWSLIDPDFADADVRSASKATLAELLKQGGAKGIKYTYDFGDGWEHTVKVEAVSPAAADATYPRLLDAKGACPPEDVGGPWGYAEYLEAIADPDHERHEEFIEWRGPRFDPTRVNEAAVRKQLERLTKRPASRKGKASSKPKHAG